MKIILLFILINIFLLPFVFGYDDVHTHPYMSGESINLIELMDPKGYEELINAREIIKKGSTDEDHPVTNVRNHFYNPVTFQGLLPGLETSLVKGSRLWSNIIKNHFYLNPQSKFKSFYEVGKILHLLVQDMASPPHVHSDPHLFIDFGGDGSVAEAVTGRDLSKQGNFPTGKQIKGQFLNKIDDFARAVSINTYDKSMFPYLVSKGKLKFKIENTQFEADFQPAIPIGPLFGIEIPARWRLEGINGKKLYSFPSIVGDGFIVLVSWAQDFWPVPENLNHVYIDRPEFLDVNGTRLDEWLITQSAPTGIEYGAGLLKLFHDIVNEPPYLKDVLISDNKSGAVAHQVHIGSGQSSGSRRQSPQNPQPLFLVDVPYDVRLVFSEPVENPVYKLGANSVTNLNSTDGGTTWSGNLVFTNANNPNSCGTQQDLIIQARDKHNHLALPNRGSGVEFGADLDLDPTTIAHRDTDAPAYTWNNYETNTLGIAGQLPGPCACDPTIPDTVDPVINLSNNLPACHNKEELEIEGSIKDNCGTVNAPKINGQSITLDQNGNFKETIDMTKPKFQDPGFRLEASIRGDKSSLC